jgi:uncharacterized protein (DUF433 family)
MTVLETMQPVPLEAGTDGVIRLAGSRVTLDTVVREFKRGATAEEIQQDFPSLALREIYGAISYYLAQPDRVEAYLREQAQTAARLREDLVAAAPADLRQRLRARRLVPEE